MTSTVSQVFLPSLASKPLRVFLDTVAVSFITEGHRLGDTNPLVTMARGCLGAQIFQSQGLQYFHGQTPLPRT